MSCQGKSRAMCFTGVKSVLLSGVLLGSGCSPLASQPVRSTRSTGTVYVAPLPAEKAAATTQPRVTDAGREQIASTTSSGGVERPPVRTDEPTRLKPLPLASADERAQAILDAANRSDWALLRANALEALIADPELLRTIVAGSLFDQNRGVRFVATMAIGRTKLCDLQVLVKPLLEDPSPSVRAAAIYACTACGDPVDQTPLGGMVLASDPEIRANAFMVLGLIGNESAKPLIRSALGHGLGLVDPVRVRLVDLQGAAALVRLGDEQEIEPIRAALFAPVEQAELTALAIQLVAQLGDEGSRQMLVRLVEAPSREARPPEIRLAAAEAIAVLGAREPAPLLRLAAEYVDSPLPEVRAQAASLLGEVDDGTARALLSDLMQDPDPVVRVAAAGSFLKLGEGEPKATASVH